MILTNFRSFERIFILATISEKMICKSLNCINKWGCNFEIKRKILNEKNQFFQVS